MNKMARTGLIAVALAATAAVAADRLPAPAPEVRRDVQRADAPGEETYIVELQHARAVRVGEHVRNLFGAPPHVRFSVDENTNILMVRARPDIIQDVRQVVEVLEEAGKRVADASEPQVRVRPLQHVHADQVAPVVLRIGQALSPAAPCQVDVDRRTNSVLFTGCAATLDRLEAVLHELDRPGEADAAPVPADKSPQAKKATRKPGAPAAPAAVRAGGKKPCAAPSAPTTTKKGKTDKVRVRRPAGSSAAVLSSPPPETNVQPRRAAAGVAAPNANEKQSG